MPPTLENTKFKKVSFILFLTSFYIFSLIITSVGKGRNNVRPKRQNQPEQSMGKMNCYLSISIGFPADGL